MVCGRWHACSSSSLRSLTSLSCRDCCTAWLDMTSLTLTSTDAVTSRAVSSSITLASSSACRLSHKAAAAWFWRVSIKRRHQYDHHLSEHAWAVLLLRRVQRKMGEQVADCHRPTCRGFSVESLAVCRRLDSVGFLT